jgi:hypothetical protein
MHAVVTAVIANGRSMMIVLAAMIANSRRGMVVAVTAGAMIANRGSVMVVPPRQSHPGRNANARNKNDHSENAHA